MFVRLGNINSLNLIYDYSGQAVMALLALISISPPIMQPHYAAVCGETFIEVGTT